jgi:hypothetical protein
MGKAMYYLRSRYSQSVYILSAAQREQQAIAQNAIRQDSATVEKLDERGMEIIREQEAVEAKFLAPLNDAYSQAMIAAQTAQEQLSESEQSLKDILSANNYLEDFSPAAIETSTTDAGGNFVIDTPKEPSKVFVKTQKQVLDSVENYYWLVDLPPQGQKLILSNGNLFVPSS